MLPSRVGEAMSSISYSRHQFPPVVIQPAFWLYLRFALSYRDVQELLAERGLDVSDETVRRWVLKFDAVFARRLRARRSRPSFAVAPGRDGRRDRRPGPLPVAVNLTRLLTSDGVRDGHVNDSSVTRGGQPRLQRVSQASPAVGRHFRYCLTRRSGRHGH